uniref:Uncharacterized protein n=1 Tax=Tanacetum cinerariifolium TaxID=118510 RepID=A0A6L2P7G1_TANCI|nr:hypothetical protein [Tanacetum cinerariifolium]
MANLSEDIQCAGSDTRPPMLDRTDFASWQQRIRLYCRGKENGVNILKSIDEGPFQMGTFRETLVEGEEGSFHLDIWDNVKMLLEGSELTKEDQESQLYNDFEHFPVKLNRGLRDSNYDQLYAYLKQHEEHVKDNKMMLDRFTQHTVDPLALKSNVSHQPNQATVQDGRVVVQNVQGRQNRGLRNNARGLGAAGYGGAHNKVGNANLGQARQIKCYNYNGGQDNVVDEDVDEPPGQNLALNVDNVFQADDCDAFDYDVDEAPTAQTMFMENISFADPIYDEAIYKMHDNEQPHYVVDSHSDYANVSNMIPYDQYVKDNANKVAIGHKNPLYLTRAQQVQPALYNGHEIIKTNHVSTIVHNSEDTLEIADITTKKMNDKMKDPECVIKKVNIEPPDYSKENYLTTFTPQKQLTPEQIFWSKDLLKMKKEALKEQNPGKHGEIEQKNLLIANDNLIADCLSKDVFYTATKYVQSRGNMIRDLREKISQLTKTHSAADPIHDLKALDSQIKELHAKVNALYDLNERWRAKNEKVKRHYKKLYDSIKITRAQTIEKNSLLTEVANLKAQIKENPKSNCVTMYAIKSKVVAPGMYVIDVEPIPSRNRNSRDVHLVYLKHLKKSVATLREIVKEARVEKPLDCSLASACRYTKHSQELVEYVIGTCPTTFHKRDEQIASTPVTRIKRVTFMDQCETSTTNTLTNVKQQTLHKTNEPVIPFIGVKSATAASGSKPRSNTKKDTTLPAKSDINKVKVHPRNNKSSVKRKNRVDYSISYKRTVINSHSNSVFKTCNKCLMSVNHAKCVVKSMKSVTKTPIKKVWQIKQVKHIWQVYYVEGLGHNLFSVGQFCDSDLEVAFRKHSCYVQDTDGVELIKASKNKSWLWHHRLNHLNFDTINELARKDLVRGLPRVKFEKDHLCSACQLEYYENVGILYQKSVLRTPQQNDVVKRQNCTLVEAAQTMLIFSKALIEDLGKLQPTADIRISVGYAPIRKGYRIYNKRTRRIMETIHIQFNELTEPMAPVQRSTGPTPTFLMPGQISLGLVPNSVPAAPYVPPTNKDLEMLFQPMFDEYLEPPRVKRPVFPASAVPVLVNSAGTPSSSTIAKDAPSLSQSSSSSASQSSSLLQGVAAESTIMEDNPFAPVDNDPFVNVFAPEPRSEASSSRDVSSAESNYVTQTHYHLEKWSKDHLLDNVIGNPSRPVSTENNLQPMPCEPKNFKSAITEDCWFQAMQDEIHEFDRLQVWELVPRPNCVTIIDLKWIYKIKLDEYGDVLKNKARLVAKGYRQEKAKHDHLPDGCQDDIPEWRIEGRSLRSSGMGLWYSKDTAIALTTYADADHAGCQDTQRSTSGSAQFLGDKLVSWSSKKRRALRSLQLRLNTFPLPSISAAIMSSTPSLITLTYGTMSLENAKLLRDALEITPVDQAHQFVSPPLGDAIIDFVNQLGYTKIIHFVSRMAVINLYQPWRAILSMINQCLTSKTSGHDRPRYPVLKILWGIITSTNVDYAELLWEEFVQAIQTFLIDKIIICHLGRIHNIHQRSASPFHLAEEYFRLGNLKFIPKGKINEVFGMPIPDELISNNIKNAPYYNAYLEMVAKHDRKVAAEKEGKKKIVSAKQPKSKPAVEKSSKPAPAPKPEETKERPSKVSTAKPPKPKPDLFLFDLYKYKYKYKYKRKVNVNNINREATFSKVTAFSKVKTFIQSLNPEIAYPDPNGAWSFWGEVVEVVESVGNVEEWQESGEKWGCGELAGKMVKDEQ